MSTGATLHALASPRTMRASVREARMTLDRIFLAAGIPDGLVQTTREHALMSVALGLGGWTMVRERHATIGHALGVPATVAGEGDGRAFDGGGKHAWLVGATVLDLAIDAAEGPGRGAVLVSNVDCAAELAVLEGLARRQGFEGRVVVLDERSARVEVVPVREPSTLAEWDPVLHRALHDGLPVDEALWWELHHLSNRALSPDTVESRRHAGPIIVAADGRIIGRPVDDETDVSLLRHDQPQKHAAR